jgi:hypothetical protein
MVLYAVWYGSFYAKFQLEWMNFIFIDEKGYKTYWTSIMYCLPAKIRNIYARNEQTTL